MVARSVHQMLPRSGNLCRWSRRCAGDCRLRARHGCRPSIDRFASGPALEVSENWFGIIYDAPGGIEECQTVKVGRVPPLVRSNSVLPNVRSISGGQRLRVYCLIASVSAAGAAPMVMPAIAQRRSPNSTGTIEPIVELPVTGFRLECVTPSAPAASASYRIGLDGHCQKLCFLPI